MAIKGFSKVNDYITMLGTGNALSTRCYNTCFTLHGENGVLRSEKLPEGRKNGYTLGDRQFIERFKVGLFVPMHFTTGFETSWRMKEFTDEKNIPFWEITREGETKKI